MFLPFHKTMHMKNTPTILQMPHSTILIRNIDAVQSFVKNTLHETKKEIGEGLSFFKDGIADKFHKTSNYLSNLVLPVNNFIKDFTQIDQEFEAERMKNSEYCICLDGQMIPASQVLEMDMEENY